MRRSNEDHYSLMASVFHNNQYMWGNCLNAHHSRKNRRLVQNWRDATNSMQHRPPTEQEATLWRQRGWIQGALEPPANSSAQPEYVVNNTCPAPKAPAPEQAWTNHSAESHHTTALQPSGECVRPKRKRLSGGADKKAAKAYDELQILFSSIVTLFQEQAPTMVVVALGSSPRTPLEKFALHFGYPQGGPTLGEGEKLTRDNSY